VPAPPGGARDEPARGAATRWDPACYLRFAAERLRPARELLQRVPLADPRSIVDLGCGDGSATRLLAERWPGAAITGLDHSPEMLARAAGEPAAAAKATTSWLAGDIRTWAPERPVDLIFSNAALHWIEGHRELLPRLIDRLQPGGCLALQVPRSFDAPSHRLLRETLAGGGPGGRALGSAQLRAALVHSPVLEPREYGELLAPYARHVDAWETEYQHVLAGRDPVLEWVRGTALRPVLAGLDAAERALFLEEYARRLRSAYPELPDGRTLFPFRRFFLVALL
jgi:trans-aconitate 2-methyltransferase